MSSFFNFIGISSKSPQEGLITSWLGAEVAVLSTKAPSVLSEIGKIDKFGSSENVTFKFFLKHKNLWRTSVVRMPVGFELDKISDIDMAAAMCLRHHDCSSTGLPSFEELNFFHSNHSELAWTLFGGPRIMRSSQWVIADQAGDYYLWMRNTYGETRILARCLTKQKQHHIGIVSLSCSNNGSYEWELVKFETVELGSPSASFLQNCNELKKTIVVSNSEFCEAYLGIFIALLVEEQVEEFDEQTDEQTLSENLNPDIKVRDPQIEVEVEEDLYDEEMPLRFTQTQRQDAVLVDGLLNQGQMVDLVAYAEFCILDSWVEIGHVLISIDSDINANLLSSDISSHSNLVLTCASSAQKVLSTSITHNISMIQRDTCVRWISQNEKGLFNIVVCAFERAEDAKQLCQVVAAVLGVKALPLYALQATTGRLKELPSTHIPTPNDPVTIFTSSGLNTSSALDGSSMEKRPSLLKSATNRILALNSTVRGFKRGLDVARERKGLMTLARASGMERMTEQMLEHGDFTQARKLVLRRNNSRRKSSEYEQVQGLSVDDLHLEEEPFAFGGSGKLYRGKLGDMSGETPVIAKCMLESDLNSNKQLLNEVRILSSLHHPNIIRVFGVSEGHLESNLWYLVEEYADKGDLSVLIQNEEVYTPALFAKVSLELVEAVKFMHSHTICHLDLKLENVLLKGENFTVKVADFGTSKHRQRTVLGGEVSSSEESSEDEQVSGTICYMPPETFEDTHKAKLPSEFAWDCYSLSIILWAMWERKTPWVGMGVCQIFNNVVKGRRPKFTGGTLPPAPSPELRLLVTAMWNRHAQNRPDINSVHHQLVSNILPPLKFLLDVGDWQASATDTHRDSICSAQLDFVNLRESKAIVRSSEYPPNVTISPPELPEGALSLFSF